MKRTVLIINLISLVVLLASVGGCTAKTGEQTKSPPPDPNAGFTEPTDEEKCNELGEEFKWEDDKCVKQGLTTISPEEQAEQACNEKTGWTWTDGGCLEDEVLDLGEEDCKAKGARYKFRAPTEGSQQGTCTHIRQMTRAECSSPLIWKEDLSACVESEQESQCLQRWSAGYLWLSAKSECKIFEDVAEGDCESPYHWRAGQGCYQSLEHFLCTGETNRQFNDWQFVNGRGTCQLNDRGHCRRLGLAWQNNSCNFGACADGLVRKEINRGVARCGPNYGTATIAAGGNTTCGTFVTSTDASANLGLFCWGDNSSGQAGTSPTAASSIPTPSEISYSGSGAVKLDVGPNAACLIATDSGRCWGRISTWSGPDANNKYGEWLYNLTRNRGGIPISTEINGILTVVNSPTEAKMAGTTLQGAVDSYSQHLAGGGRASNYTSTGPNWLRSAALGSNHMCGLNSDGTPACVGRNDWGQIGGGDWIREATAANQLYIGAELVTVEIGSGSGRFRTKAEALTDFERLHDHSVMPTRACQNTCSGSTEIASGENHSCYVAASGNIFCWGRSTNGQLGGVANSARIQTPISVTNPTGYKAISVAAGNTSTCGIYAEVKEDGSHSRFSGGVWCWGRIKSRGTGPTVPRPIEGLERDVSQVAIGGHHACAIKGRKLYCWGDGSKGQLGNGERDDSDTPTLVSHGEFAANQVNAIALGQEHSCASLKVGQADKLYCWGSNSAGQLGASSVSRNTADPTLVQPAGVIMP